ncbi:MAG: DNA translocase FtsK [Bulleidia sp.]|nr:DNA translocase FtsK [Bulleidia sp.]
MADKKKKTTTTRTRVSAKKKQELEEQAAKQELKDWISIVLILAVLIVAYSRMGLIGEWLSMLCRFLFGQMYYLMLTLIVVQIIITLINRHGGNTRSRNPVAIIILCAAIILICAYRDTPRDLKGLDIIRTYAGAFRSFFTEEPELPVAGGIIGAALLSLTTGLFDYTGTLLVIIVLFIITALLLVNLKVYKQAFESIRNYFSTRAAAGEDEEEEYTEEEETEEEEPEEAPVAKSAPVKKDWQPQLRSITVDDAPESDDVEETVSLNIPKSVRTEPVTHMINVDDTVDNAEPEEVKPIETRSSFGINADAQQSVEEKQEEPVLGEEKEPESIFMTVDDLVDNTVQPEDNPEPIGQRINFDELIPEDDEEEEETQTPVEEEPVQPEVMDEPVMEEEEEAEQNAVPESTLVKPADAARPAEPAGERVLSPCGTRNNAPYKLPKANLLDPIPVKEKNDPNEAAAKEKGELLIQVLRNFDIEAKLIDTHIGPAVTKFEIRPDANVKVSRILGLADDIKMQLAVRDVRIEAPIPGHNAVGIEVPNVKAVPVKMKELLGNIPEKDKNQPLLVMLGKDLMGNCVTCRLDKMPHLLIAGATGSGKSVCMNSIICSLLLRTKPDEVKMLLVDPKKVEFTPYQKIPHLIGPVINDPNQANNALKVIVKIMDDRYNAFAKAGVRNIQGFNQMVETAPAPEDGSPKPKKMPYIVVIVDEMADLMAVAGKEVELSIQRITQLARAAGIHLIIATQRPSVDVITGVIKANIPSRIAFAVSSSIDSKTILDHGGAERLLGNGDMLYMPIGASSATRVQGVFVTDDEVHRISQFVSEEAVPMYDDAFVRLEGIDDNDPAMGGVADAGDDPLYEEIKKYVIDAQKASTSLLQRRFGIGYNRAARMIDVLEEKGIIGPAQGSKPREVYIKPEGKGDE